MANNEVWKLIEPPKNCKPIGCKWVYKIKKNSKERIECFKVRFFAKSFIQKQKIDYTETFSPVFSKDSFRIIIALVAHSNLELHQIDIKTTFLNDDLTKKVYMK